MYYVYIIFSKSLNKKYIGYTNDLKNRLLDHNSGYSKFTSQGIPWRLIYYEVFNNQIDVLNEEKFLKSGKGRDRLNFLLINTIIKL